MQTVHITCFGVLSPWGVDLAAFEAALFGGRSAVRSERLELPGSEAFQVPLARSVFDTA